MASKNYFITYLVKMLKKHGWSITYNEKIDPLFQMMDRSDY